MAVRELEFEPVKQPRLQLVPAEPRGRPLWATLFVILLATLLALPVIRSLGETVSWPAFHPRSIAATEIAALDRLTPLRRPRSSDPVAGIAFVRCTRLWVADPDGARPHPIAHATGVTYPTFSPDGRTIAYVTSGTPQVLWMIGADGTDPTELGPLTMNGSSLPAAVEALSWSPDGNTIAFALRDATYGPAAGGSAIWTFDVDSGRFARQGSGWPAPFWNKDHLGVAQMDDGLWDIAAFDGGPRAMREVSSEVGDVTAGVISQGWLYYNRGVVLLREHGRHRVLAIRRLWGQRDKVVVRPPHGYSIPRFAHPSISTDGSRVIVDLLDAGAGRDVGLYDPQTKSWTVLDYAWNSAVSPVPGLIGSIDEQRADLAARQLFETAHNAPMKFSVLTGSRKARDVIPWRSAGYVMRRPTSTGGGSWSIATVAFPYRRHNRPYRSLRIDVHKKNGLVMATPTATSPIREVTDVESAFDFASTAVGYEVSRPTLPKGTRLTKWPFDAYSWNGKPQVVFHFALPGNTRRNPKTFSVGYGEDLSFSLGCGGENDPAEGDVDGVSALVDHVPGTNQVIWPATPEDRHATMTVYGTIGKDEVLEIARSMQN